MGKGRFTRNSFTKLFELSADPVYLLNSDREVVFANDACGEWLDCDAAELLGIKTEYHSGFSTDALRNRVAVLCPPPELLSGSKSFAQALVHPSHCEMPAAVRFHLIGRDLQQSILALVDLKSVALTECESISIAARALHEKLQKINRQRKIHWGDELLTGQGSLAHAITEQVQLAAESNCNLLISGPAGSGLLRLAEQIYAVRVKNRSGLAPKLIPIDCARLSHDSLQRLITELIDLNRQLDREQKFTFLFQDIDQLEQNSQLELQGLIQLETVPFHAIALSHRTREELLTDGKFLSDLVYEISPLAITLPPLTDRRDDIPLYAQFYLEENNTKVEKQLAGFTAEALDELLAYPWPQNLQQLREVIFAACDRAQGDFVTVSDLPPLIKHASQAARYPAREIEQIELDPLLAEIEQKLIERALAAAKGNKTKAAQLLGITRARLHRKLGESESTDDPE
jgi:DNA-binding NtrC family response regulator